MQLFVVPKWLQSRRILKNDLAEIQQLFLDKNTPLVGELSVELLKQYYQVQSKVTFYKVVRLLGFYGVIFSGKLSSYSGPNEKRPGLLNIPLRDRQNRLAYYTSTPSLALLGSCGIETIEQLHGVPVQSLKKLLDCLPSFEDFINKIPATIVPAAPNFFFLHGPSDAIQQMENEQPEERAEILCQPVNILNLSVRSYNCLRNKGINTIGELVKIKPEDLLNTKNFGRKSLREITGKLSRYNLELGSEIGTTINQNPAVFIKEKFKQSVGVLNLSVRATNCLKRVNVATVDQLAQLSDHELLALPNLGQRTLKELQGKIKKLRADMALPAQPVLFPVKDSFGIDLDNEETLANLTTSIRDLILSVRTRNALDTHNIEYIWQVVSSTEKQLLQIKNFGRKSLNELKERLSELDLYLGIVFSPEQIVKIQSFKKDPSEQEFDELFLDKLNDRFSQIIDELQQNPLPFLDKRENQIAHERLWPTTTKRTLEDIASELSVSRERIRQIEKKTKSKIKQQYRKVLQDIVSNIHKVISIQGDLGSISQLPVRLYSLDRRTQPIITELIALIDDKIFLDWEFDLITVNGNSWIVQICSSIKTNIQKASSDKFFTQSILDQAVSLVMAEYDLNEDMVQVHSRLVKKVQFAENISASRNLLCFGRVTKQDQAVLLFKAQFPEGLNIHKQADQLLEKLRDKDAKTFGNATPKSIIARLADHPDIFLWGRGFYIHQDNISFDMNVVQEAVDWIIKRFKQGHPKFQVGLPYGKLKDKMQKSFVPNEYALYTLLRVLNNDRIGQRKFPTLVDRQSDVDIHETVREELENYFLEAKGSVPYSQLRREFIDKRGWKHYRLQMQLSSQSEKIFPWKNHSYIHLEFLSVDYEKLDKFICEIRNKLSSIQGAYSLKGALQEFQVLWHQVCPDATIPTMIKLIRSADPEDLEIDHYLISFQKKSGTESISLAAELEDFFIEQNRAISIFELKKEFQEARGWSDNQYYGALRKAHFFEASRNSLVHPSTIHYDQKLSEQVYGILNNTLEAQNSNGIPHGSVSEIIDEYILPELPNDIEWTIELLKSIGEKFGDFLFFDDACILLENQFDIADLDDMIAYLISRSFMYNLAKKKEVEKLLWREGILASGRLLPKNDVFFPESSIKYLPDSDEIMLSQIGEERYACQKPPGNPA